MLKRISKKILPLFFVIAVLTQFCCAMEMKTIDPCCTPSTTTKITDIPNDCLIEIFGFYRGKNEIKLAFLLMLVCKEFKQLVRIMPLDIEYFGNISSNPSRFGTIEKLKINGCAYKSLKKNNWLKNLPYLKELSLQYCKITELDQLPPSLEKMTLIFCNKFTGEKKLPKNLQALSLESCDKFVGLKKEASNLKTFSITCCKKFDAKSLKKTPNLKKLVVWICKQFTGKGLEDQKDLQELTLNCMDSDNFSGEYLKHLKGLKKLTLKCAQKVNDGQLEKLMNLRFLELIFCGKFTGKALKKLSELRELRVNGASEKFNDTMMEKGLKKLETLELRGFLEGKFTKSNLQKNLPKSTTISLIAYPKN